MDEWKSRLEIYAHGEAWLPKVAGHADQKAAMKKIVATTGHVKKKMGQEEQDVCTVSRSRKPWREGLQEVKDLKKMHAQCKEQKIKGKDGQSNGKWGSCGKTNSLG